MTKPTTEDRIKSLETQIAWLEMYLTGAGRNFEPEGVQAAMHDDLAHLRKQLKKLINPPAPRPRKPKAPDTLLDSTVYVKLPTANKATFEPTDTYVNSKPKTGRNRP